MEQEVRGSKFESLVNQKNYFNLNEEMT